MTKSMQGFLKKGTDTPYLTLLKAVEGAAISTRSDRSPTLWKFGTALDVMRDRNERFSYEAYESKLGYKDNDYRVVVRHQNQDQHVHLQVIVTDLFQSDNDIEAVSEAILSRYFNHDHPSDPLPPDKLAANTRARADDSKTANNNAPLAGSGISNSYAVGILGVKIPFRGKIFDFGQSRHTLMWNGDRPVYVVVLGMKADVLNYLSSLKAEASKDFGTSVGVVQISPALVGCSSPINSLVLESKKGLDEIESLMTVRSHPQVKEFRIPRGAGNSEFTLNVPFEFVPFSLNAVPGDLIPQIVVTRARIEGEDGFENAPEGNEAFRGFSTLKTSEKHLMVKLMIPADKNRLLIKGRIYRVEIVVSPQRQSIQMPTWINEWSITGDAKPDGAKTLNLGPFVRELWNGMTKKDPEIFHAFFYVRKD